ncbi:DUF1156 domain-containing protein [Dialister succinatiphilus]|uniref:DUF1156 domain-containing protein n=1 Tax=Dialister succinatiphilus YIT 11850 TaxID=742743 RepID=H1D2Q7_9FIRM|nr:DUF1156 domain-containing protein [Dialister succinatiphilus]EHO62177.1 hypothetical protein HMPREF9453_01895 [Dialister succinatiphilus YIT 11850]
MKKVIETTIPLQELNRSAMTEKTKKNHPRNMHPWWKRSPVYSSAALLAALLWDAPSDEERIEAVQQDLIHLAWGKDYDFWPENEVMYSDREHADGFRDGRYCHDEFDEKILDKWYPGDTYRDSWEWGGIQPTLIHEERPIICDPFCGYGGLELAADKLALSVKAGDLNPVAALLTRAVLELPRFCADWDPINPGIQSDFEAIIGDAGDDLLYYGERLKEKVYKKMASFYPDIALPDGTKAPAYAYVWVRTMKCPNPACGYEMPMAGSFILSEQKGKEFWAEPVWEEGKLHFHVHRGLCPEDKKTNKHGSRGARFICPHCGAITTDQSVIEAGQKGQLHYRMMAVAAETKESRIFVEPDEAQLRAAKARKTKDVPEGRIPDNSRWFSTPRFGMKNFSDLYLPRQMYLLESMCSLLPDVIREIQKDVDHALGNTTPDTRSLEEGGTGSTAYSQALGVYLGLAISYLSDYQSTCCSWDHRKGYLRSSITRNALPMTWVIGEGNPFSTVSGNFDSLVKKIAPGFYYSFVGIRVKEGDTCKTLYPNKIEVKQVNALQISFPKDSVLFTELPYYDHIGYADLSDYYYIWLRKCLKDIYPELFSEKETPKDELSSIPEHYGGNREKALAAYRNGLTQLFTHFYPSASTEYPSLVFFEYQEDEEAPNAENKKAGLSPFGYLLKSIMNSGFMITALWPIRTARAGVAGKSIRTAVVFRKGGEKRPAASKRDFIAALKRELPDILGKAYEGTDDEKDRYIVGLGMGLQIFTSFRSVLNADGSTMTLEEALPILRQTIDRRES